MANSRLQKLGSYLRPHWRAVLLGTVALLIVNGLGVYIPLLIRDTIDDLQQGGFDFDQLSGTALWLLFLAAIMWGFRMFSRVVIFGVGRQVEFILKQRIFQHLLTIEPSYFSDNRSGDLINRATSDVDNIRRLVGFAVLSFVNIIFAYAFILPAMLEINVRLSLLAVAVYPVMLITVQLFSGKLRRYQQEVQEELSNLSELIQEDMSGMALIRIYAQEDQERLAFKQRNEELLAANLRLARTRNLLFPIIEGISYISLLILLWVGTPAIPSEISIGDFIALALFVERLIFPTALLGFTITAYQQGEISIDRVEAITKAEPKIRNNSNSIVLPLTDVRGEITARNLTYTYPDNHNPALYNLNFTIKPGETVAIVGSIGSGKSTLANAIPRLLNIQPGELFLDGCDITKLELATLRKAIAYVPQDSFLFSTSIKNNIRYGEPLSESVEVESAAKQAQIHPEILTFPQEYDTLVGERGITLSGGQRQRTSLARALLVDAKVLILDDALSSVDNETATRILNSLSPTRAKKTVIFISHQLSAAANCDRILVMDEGKIVQNGTHETLVKETGLYQSLWQQHRLKEVLN